MKPKAIIIDIDGTLANIDHRRHFVERTCTYQQHDNSYPDATIFYRIEDPNGKPDWKSFNEAMKADTPNEWCISIIKKFKPDFCIIFVTGREEKYREITDEFIIWSLNTERGWVVFPWKNHLLMRPTKDYRSQVQIKREIYEQHIKDKYEVLFAIDDSKVIADLWRSLGIVCLDCAGYQG